HRRLRRWLCRAIAAGALAVRTIRHVAVGSQLVLLLLGPAGGVLVSGRGLAVAPHRFGQHHGLYPRPIESLSHPGGILAKPAADALPAAHPRGSRANGCADAVLLRDGGGSRSRATGRGE